MHFHCLQHVPFETPGTIETWIREKGHSISFTLLYDSGQLPSLHHIDALIIMGGPMSVHDDAVFPWLKKEKEFIAAAIEQGKKIAGICLGAQLIATVLGAKVYDSPEKEIGFMPVQFTEAAGKLMTDFPSQEVVFHWHGETFDLPAGAIRLASTPICENQAYIIGNNIIGLQFHLEVNPLIVQEMIKYEGYELVSAPYIQSAEKILQQLHHLESNKMLLFQLFDIFFL